MKPENEWAIDNTQHSGLKQRLRPHCQTALNLVYFGRSRPGGQAMPLRAMMLPQEHLYRTLARKGLISHDRRALDRDGSYTAS